MHGFKIGRVFGIELRIDWSWLFIFLLMTWNLIAIFSSWHPSWDSETRLATALCASVLFFLGIVVHELAHSLVARAYGVRVRSITLLLFGGVSNIKDEPPSASAELLIAIGVAFFVIGVLAIG